MFDIGFWEIVVIASIALIIVGPAKLPKFAQDAAKFVYNIRYFIQKTKQELEKDFKLDDSDELKKDIKKIDKLMRQAPDRLSLLKDQNSSNNSS